MKKGDFVRYPGSYRESLVRFLRWWGRRLLFVMILMGV